MSQHLLPGQSAAQHRPKRRTSAKKHELAGKTKGQANEAFRAITEKRNKRNVWTVPSEAFTGEFCTACRSYFDGPALAALRVEKFKIMRKGQEEKIKRRWCSCGRSDAWLSHFATFPPKLIEPCVLAGCRPGGVILDPFGGAGTTGLVADRNHRDAILIELNGDYAEMARLRLRAESPLFAAVS